MWRLGEDCLIEDKGEWRRLYGRWDGQFGCWLQSNDGTLAITPDWPLLGKHGLWLEPSGERDDEWYKARAAIAAYFSLIPTPIRRLVAHHGRQQWTWLETIWRDPKQAILLDASPGGSWTALQSL
jgi:hypothetical protein